MALNPSPGLMVSGTAMPWMMADERENREEEAATMGRNFILSAGEVWIVCVCLCLNVSERTV